MAKAKFATNNFNYQFSLVEHIILRLDGPMNDCYQKTCHLEMKGEGCRDFEKRNPDKNWVNLIYFMVKLNARFKRIDIAIDDFKGEYVTKGWLLERINKEQFTYVFRSEPNPLGTLKNGLIIQFSSNESKVELAKIDDAIPNQFEAYMKAARPYVSMCLFLKYLQVLRDLYLFELEIPKATNLYAVENYDESEAILARN